MNLHKALEKIRQWVGDRKAKSYTRKGCKLSLANLKSKPANRVVLDVDRAYPPGKAKKNQCDFILFHIDDAQKCLVSVPIELKRGDVDASDVEVQLQAGADIADKIAPKGANINLVPILVHGGSLHKIQRNKLRKCIVIFRGEESKINTTRCGHKGNLAAALSKSTKR